MIELCCRTMLRVLRTEKGSFKSVVISLSLPEGHLCSPRMSKNLAGGMMGTSVQPERTAQVRAGSCESTVSPRDSKIVNEGRC